MLWLALLCCQHLPSSYEEKEDCERLSSWILVLTHIWIKNEKDQLSPGGICSHLPVDNTPGLKALYSHLSGKFGVETVFFSL